MANFQYTSPRTGAQYTGFAVSSGRRAATQYRHAMTYHAAATALGTRERRQIANNTTLIRRAEDTIAVRLHATDVVTLYADGTVRLSSGGWATVTTKDRLNTYSPVGRVWSERGTWYLYPANGGTRVLFFDRMLLDAAGTILNYADHVWARAAQECEDARMAAHEARAQKRAGCAAQ